MAIVLSQMMGKLRTCKVTFQGESMDVTYRPNIVTPVLIDEINSLTGRDSLDEQVVRIIDHWDLLDTEGKQIPVDKDNLKGLPSTFLRSVINGLMADMRAPDDDEKKD